MSARRTLPSPTAHHIVIGERHGMPRLHHSLASAFVDERFCCIERTDAPGLMAALSRALRRWLHSSKGTL